MAFTRTGQGEEGYLPHKRSLLYLRGGRFNGGLGRMKLTWQCDEGVGLAGHLGLPLVHAGDCPHLSDGLPRDLFRETIKPMEEIKRYRRGVEWIGWGRGGGGGARRHSAGRAVCLWSSDGAGNMDGFRSQLAVCESRVVGPQEHREEEHRKGAIPVRRRSSRRG